MKKLLFLCTGNSCRSQMAEVMLNNLGRGRFEALSAGSKPAGFVHPLALRALEAAGYPCFGLRSKPMAEFRGRSFDAVITVCDCAREACPAWPGARMLHWGFEDPAEAKGSEEERLAVFRRVRGEIEAALRRFIEAPFPAHGPRRHILPGMMALLLCGAGARAEVLFPTQHGVWRVSASGSAETVPGAFVSDGISGELYLGSTLPLVSPDERHVAYSKGRDLWLYDTKSGKSTRAVSVAGGARPGYADVYTLLTGWSWDGGSLLYYVSHDMVEDPEGESPDLLIEPRRYGFFLYDLAAGKSRPVELPGHFLAWLPGGDFLLLSKDEKAFLRYTPGAKAPVPLLTLDYPGGSQTALSPDGRRLLFVAYPKSGSSVGSLISQLDLANGSTTTITAPGSWAEYQDPLFSPSGRSISYFRRTGEGKEWPILSLVVDGKPVYEYLGHPPPCRWVDEDTLVLSARDGAVMVLDARTGREKGRRGLK